MKHVHWTLYFFLLTCGISAVGATLGAVTFPILGVLLDWKFSAAELITNGAKNLGFLFFVWAVPISAIATVIRAQRKKTASR